MASNGDGIGPSVLVDLKNTTQGPLWTPSEMMDANGHFIVVGLIPGKLQPGGLPDARVNQAAIVSKNSTPPWEDPKGIGSYKVVRHLDLSRGSKDLDIELYTTSYGPLKGDFSAPPPPPGLGPVPRIPKKGESKYNLNFIPTFIPELFPRGRDEKSWTAESYPLNRSTILGLDEDDLLAGGVETGVAVDPPGHEPEVSNTVVGTLGRIATALEKMGGNGSVAPAGGACAFNERRAKPLTLGDWVKFRGTAKVTLTRFDPDAGLYTAARFDLVFRNLFPHSVYTAYAIRTAALQAPPQRVPEPLGLPNVAVSDSRGNAQMSFEVPTPFPDPATDPLGLRIINLVIAHKSDYQNWGAKTGLFGPGVRTQACFNTWNEDGILVGRPPNLQLFEIAPGFRTTLPKVYGSS